MCNFISVTALIGILLSPPVQAAGLPSSYIEWEKPCPAVQHCWEFRANVWHVEGESEALNRGHAFHFEKGETNRLELTLRPGEEAAELVVELFDPRYQLVDRLLIRSRTPLRRSVDWSAVETGRYHVFVYFRRGGVHAQVSGRLYHG
ncbi:hypothetical protein ACFQ49_17025 [Kroppenstedtia eburnea]|uniref:Uncharacterized protein n=1 Tax=Kroppenstedtia eburnea TaxID=714067 RepID=A0A1N7JRS1_9BACL|nr:hypothetical protein [Kroppenstedtia eburnea]EGK10662.1 hypothetical protein HMPREF9374_2322 [Desmospora sp. 8437]QKI83457.1 hypothetical protein GXN75_16565 [Kroppenstedtia eburnea]SIS52052.1 hypothetical protein SAMN05421790_102273 [Kroppenstedtia eburnea]